MCAASANDDSFDLRPQSGQYLPLNFGSRVKQNHPFCLSQVNLKPNMSRFQTIQIFSIPFHIPLLCWKFFLELAEINLIFYLYSCTLYVEKEIFFYESSNF